MADAIIDAAELRALATAAFRHAGLGEADAALAAEGLVETDLMGVGTHGVTRLDTYCGLIARGTIKADAVATADRTAPSLAAIDGGHGLGVVVGARAMDEAVALAEQTGLGFVTVRDSSHFGAAGLYALRACRRDMVALAITNASPAMAPFGGRDLIIGNNPFALGAPRRDAFPLILDMALSVAARGKMRRLRDADQEMPAGWALDSDGRPTTDPAAGLDGFIQFVGGHKGYGLAVMMDLLAGVLSGGAFLTGSLGMWQDEAPMRTSHAFLALDPARLMPREAYDERVEAFCAEIKGCRPFAEGGEVLLPGELEGRAHARQSAEGIRLPEKTLETVRRLAAGG